MKKEIDPHKEGISGEKEERPFHFIFLFGQNFTLLVTALKSIEYI